jgi:hypothetical protein
MAYVFPLPKDIEANKQQTADIFAYLVAKGKSRRNPIATNWLINHYYMMGLRNFYNINYGAGSLNVSYMDKSGVLKFKYEEILSKYQAQLGRLLSINLAPAVSRKGVSLDGLRKASTAQVVLDTAFPEDKVKRLGLNLFPPLLRYGTVGLGLWVDGEDSVGIDTIMPWELIPIPVDISSPSDMRGIARVRWVPSSWVKALAITPSKGSKAYKGMNDFKVPTGDLPPDVLNSFQGEASMSYGWDGFFLRESDSQVDRQWKGGNTKVDMTHMDVVQLTEVWLETSDGYLSEYLIFVGTDTFKQLYRTDHSASKYHMPVRVARDTVVGGFWGRSFVDQLIPLNQEIEYALSSVFQAVADFDLYGLLMWPTTIGTPPEAQRGQDGIKYIRYEQDYTAANEKPFAIQPSKLQKPQIDAVQMAVTLMDKIAKQPDEMMSGGAPGRVDSASGLGFLYETSGVPLSPTAKNTAEAVSGIYRSMLGVMGDLWRSGKVVDVTMLDDSLAGIVLDTETGQITLGENSIPSPDEVNLTVASEVPISKEQQKLELKEALEKQRITLNEYNFKVRDQGLDLPVGDEVAYQNRRRAMLENIILFGDGKTNKGVTVSPQDMHLIHKDILDAFMARPEFYAASVKIQDDFKSHLEEHMAGLGVLPDGMEQPEDAAELEMQGPPQGEF